MAKITNTQLVEQFKKFLNEGWGYVYGAQGELYSKELAEKWKRQGRAVPNKGWDRATYFTVDCNKWFGKQVADCSGGIVYAIRQYDKSYYDRNTGTFKKQFTESGDMDTLPEIPGLALWRSGHIGVYIGNGEAIEFRGTNYGCVKTKVKDRDWTHWGKIDGVTYETTKSGCDLFLTEIRKGEKGEIVKALQILLNGNGYNCGKADGIAGDKTIEAIMRYQRASGLASDGVVGKKTWTKILKGE